MLYGTTLTDACLTDANLSGATLYDPALAEKRIG